MADEHVILHEDALDELYAWIDEVPLSRPKKNIARDFSDGVLCAEVLSHFMPKSVDMHNYFCANSVNQKKVNWNTLNRKVLSKLGMKLSDGTIQYLVDAKPGAIEQILWDIRRRIQDRFGMDTVIPVTVSHSQTRGLRKSYSGRSISTSTGTNNYYSRGGPPSPDLIEVDDISESIPVRGSLSNSRSLSASHSYHNNSASSYARSSGGQGYIAPPTTGSPPNESNNNGIPATMQIIYRGQKMVPLTVLEEKIGELKGLEQTNKSLQTKIHRIETLVNVKDQRIEDLTHQLHNLRKMYERSTSSTWQSSY